MSDLAFITAMRRAERRRKRIQRFQWILFFSVLLFAAVALDWAMESVLFSIIAALP
jgi:hypothetical protein